jgi:hypothetical protein
MYASKTDIGAKDIKRLLLRVYARYQRGAISESQAMREAVLLNSVLKAIELTDLEQRLSMIESTLNTA